MAEQIVFLLGNAHSLLFGFPGQRPGGLVMSILLAVVSVLLGFVLGNLVGSADLSHRRALRWSSRVYVNIFRGIPLVLLLLLIYQLLSSRFVGLGAEPRIAAVVALTLYSSAYQAEILRAGLRSVPRQLTESARLMGCTPWGAYRTVQIRYAVRVMIPALAGQAISLFKDTSVVLIIGVSDLMMVARVVLGSDVTNTPYWVSLYMVVGLFYFLVAFALSHVARQWERKVQRTDLVHSLVNY